jgi:hypothetical protein
MGYLTFNTRSNRVVIISFVIIRIFFKSVQCHISTYFNKDTRDLFMLCIVLMCQLYYCCSIILFVVRLFHSSFVQLFFSFDYFAFPLFIVCCSKKIDSILILDCIPGIYIPLYVKYLFIIIYASQINIIHQTSPTDFVLVLEWVAYYGHRHSGIYGINILQVVKECRRRDMFIIPQIL